MGNDVNPNSLIEARRTFRFLHITFSENQDLSIRREDDGIVFEIQ